MGWDMEEQKKVKNNSLFKIIGVLIILLIIIICIILALLSSIKANTFVLSIDGKNVSLPTELIKTESDEKYINIKSFAKLVGYEFHLGEYKEYSNDQDKCYVNSSKETASFYVNSNKISKVEASNKNEDYEEFICEKNTIKIDDEFYTSTEAIEIAFNVAIKLSNKNMSVTTLDKLISKVEKQINSDSKNIKYNSLEKESFENQKALLYNYAIVSKKESNLYSVILLKDYSEIIPDKYKQIRFLESSEEFLVTNSSDKVGIIDSNGKNKIEQIYDSIKVINNNPKLYLVEKDKKFGVLNETGNIVIYCEYDSIGIDNNQYKEVQNQYMFFENIIPVCKDNKYGLFNLQGEKILDILYDGFGCNQNSVKVNKIEKKVTPVLIINECRGIVVKNKEFYDLFLVDNNELVRLQVSNIYSITDNGKITYYMIFRENEMDLIENLTKLGYIKNNNKEESSEEKDEPISAVINEVESNSNSTVGVNNNLENIVINQ